MRSLTGSSRKVLIVALAAPGECIRGISRFAREHDWHLAMDMLFTGALPRGWKGDGVLALIPYQSELLAHVHGLGIPWVAFTRTERPANMLRVDSDHGLIGRMAADHLLERAHRSFAWAPLVNDAVNRERLAGFQARLDESGCTCRQLPPAYTRVGPYWQDDWTERHRALANELRLLPRPTAIFAFNDAVAADIVDACRDSGLSVPEDIAVLGVDDSIACETSAVPISSVDPGLEEIGHRMAAVLAGLMNGEAPPLDVVHVPPRGVVTRVSTDVVAVSEPRIARALSYIAEHYPDSTLSVAEVATAVGMSRRNLERTFRDETGRTIHEHIVSVRMREASRILRMYPRTKSSEVASLVGIAEAGTFFRTFRRHFGTSPKAYRDPAVQAGCDGGNADATPQPLALGAPAAHGPSIAIRPTAA